MKWLNWRDRLALWCLRRLTPNGICADSNYIQMSLGSGMSTPRHPWLVMTLSLAGTDQTIIAVVLDPDVVADQFASAVTGLREWAEANR